MPREGHDTNTLEIRRERRDLNPRAPRGARPEKNKSAHDETEISIHVPREGHDDSVRPSRSHRCAFQSTCPARGTTRHFSLRCTPAEFQSTCPARGTTVSQQERGLPQAISIHVPREGHDRRGRDVPGAQPHFNPRAPRGARLRQSNKSLEKNHDFNPRAPRGARPPCAIAGTFCPGFQSTCPARGTTVFDPPHLAHVGISIHVPREGHDALCSSEAITMAISIHVPREGHDSWRLRNDELRKQFQSTCPARGTTWIARSRTGCRSPFQSTCPARGTTANMHNFFVQICARVTNIPLKGMPYLQKTYVSI